MWHCNTSYSIFAVVCAALVALRGYRKRSLSPSGLLSPFAVQNSNAAALRFSVTYTTMFITGATAAWVVGTLHLLAGPQFGLTLIVFFASSSKVCAWTVRCRDTAPASTLSVLNIKQPKHARLIHASL